MDRETRFPWRNDRRARRRDPAMDISSVCESSGPLACAKYATEVILLTNLEERRPYYVQTSLGYEKQSGLLWQRPCAASAIFPA